LTPGKRCKGEERDGGEALNWERRRRGQFASGKCIKNVNCHFWE